MGLRVWFSRLDWPVVVIVAAVLLALPLSILAAGDNVLQPDVAVTNELQEVDAPGTSPVVAFLNTLGQGPVLIAIGALVAALLVYAGRKRDAMLAVLPVTIAQLANVALKYSFSSPRPSGDHVSVADTLGGFGFPSGHTMTTVVLVGSLAAILLRELDCRWRRGLIIAVAIAIVLGMGFSRIYVGAHWPSDVLGAYLWGAAFTALTLMAFEAHRPTPGYLSAR